MDSQQFVLDLPELAYDISELRKVFDATKDKARTKTLKYREVGNLTKNPDDANCVVIAAGIEYFGTAEPRVNLLEFDYIKNIVDRLNLEEKVQPEHIDINWTRSGFIFEPHVDDWAWSNIMWLITPAETSAPIDYYRKDNIEIPKNQQYGFFNLTDDDILYTHYYKEYCPTVTNGLWPHGVRRTDNERILLRLKIHEPFSLLYKKYKAGRLIRN